MTAVKTFFMMLRVTVTDKVMCLKQLVSSRIKKMSIIKLAFFAIKESNQRH